MATTDLVTVGGRGEAKWLKKLLEDRFELKTLTIGLGPEDEQEAKVLNRVIRVDKEGCYPRGDDDRPWKEPEKAEERVRGDRCAGELPGPG